MAGARGTKEMATNVATGKTIWAAGGVESAATQTMHLAGSVPPS